MKKFIFLLLVFAMCVPTMSFAADGECLPPIGYSMDCSSKCGQTPGTCVTVTGKKNACLLTTGPYPGYGCHDSYETCCDPRDRDGDGTGF
ncbi:MAG TPA: hypothetical protein VGF69_25950 [Thermoanaerobaculia bacterium]